MIWMIAVVLIWLACFGLYSVSSKQIARTQHTQYAYLAKFPKGVRIISVGLLLGVILLLQSKLSNSISFIGLWILITPILFIFILRVNQKSASPSS